MTEIINILRGELKYNRAYKEVRNLKSTYAEKLKTRSTQCCKCTQLESQLQVALNERSSVKLITTILKEEFKSLKQTSHVDSKAGNSWISVKPSNSRGPTAIRPPETTYTSPGTSNTCQYTVPITNRYALLSNHLEPQHLNYTTFSPDSDQSSRFLPKIRNNHVKGHQWKKSPARTKEERRWHKPLSNNS
jgi:hypothetical protein